VNSNKGVRQHNKAAGKSKSNKVAPLNLPSLAADICMHVLPMIHRVAEKVGFEVWSHCYA